jgi:hypothetical protein
MELPKRLGTESLHPSIVLGHISRRKHVSLNAEGTLMMLGGPMGLRLVSALYCAPHGQD